MVVGTEQDGVEYLEIQEFWVRTQPLWHESWRGNTMGGELFLFLIFAVIVSAGIGGVIGLVTGCVRAFHPANHDVTTIHAILIHGLHGLLAGGCVGLILGTVAVIIVALQISKHAKNYTSNATKSTTQVDEPRASGPGGPLLPVSVDVGTPHPG